MLALDGKTAKRVFVTSLALIVATLTLAQPQAKAFSGSGAGSVADPFLISNCEDL